MRLTPYALTKRKKVKKGFFKELYFNSSNPLYISQDLGTKWTPRLVSLYVEMTEAENAELQLHWRV